MIRKIYTSSLNGSSMKWARRKSGSNTIACYYYEYDQFFINTFDRRAISRGQSVKYLVPEAVIAYAAAHKLYQSTWLLFCCYCSEVENLLVDKVYWNNRLLLIVEVKWRETRTKPKSNNSSGRSHHIIIIIRWWIFAGWAK
jgi:hypothetical protein